MAKTVSKSMITDFDKFKSAWEKDADSPYGSIMYYVIAALNIENDVELANAMMTLVVSKNDSIEDGSSPSGRKLRRTGAGYYIGQFQEDPNIARSYVGGKHEEDYKWDKNKLVMTVVKDQDQGTGKKKIFIKSGGKDMPTPVSVARNKSGQWKLTSYSSICTGVRKPASEVGDF
ncbi:MAG: DUF6935 domain-containing protein [Candidatus Thorarchaeota archaeon]|jgi:hypothetical protein